MLPSETTDALLNLRKRILQLALEAREGHVASSFSILELLFHIYQNLEIRRPGTEGNSFVLSKGHAALGYYVVLEHFGFLTHADLSGFASTQETKLGGHPTRNPNLGIEVSTGSLGHGVPIAVGMALGEKIRNTKRDVYCLLGDGEFNEGTIHESLLLAHSLQLDNLVLFLDYNHSGDRAIDIHPLTPKILAYGFEVQECDGNSLPSIGHAFDSLKRTGPSCLIAHTTKGFGSSIIAGDPSWHHRSPESIEMDSLIESLY